MGIGRHPSRAQLKIEPLRRQPKGPEEGDTMAITEITAIIALIITVVMGLPEAILTIIKIRQELAKGKRSARRPRHRR